MKKITVALAGNPNSGKTTIFNMLTGAHQHVGNYPGVTVEKKEGVLRYKDYEITFVDLPGTYCLTAHSVEELVAREFIINNHPDVVVDVVDSSNIERNLYLATQLIEMDVPLVLAFNMNDIAKQKGLVFDIDMLSSLLEVSIVPTVGSKTRGKQELLCAIIKTVEKEKTVRVHKIAYGTEIEKHLREIEELLKIEEPQLSEKYGSAWLAVKLLERDDEIYKKIQSRHTIDTIAKSIESLKSVFRDEPEIIIADRRYGFISGACQETIRTTVEYRHNISDIIDAVVINRILGLPIFLILMYVVFQLTFSLGRYPMDGLERLFSWSAVTIADFWPAGSEHWLKSLLVDGVIGGVCGVIVFLPNILLLFAAISILEASGYMARAAFVMDHIMHKIGLHGKSFIPMLIGFGCSVPAIMATRILENRRNRLTTIMVIPLMSCGARLTIYALIIPAFFENKAILHWGVFSVTSHALLMMSIYLIGIVLAVICAKVLRLSVFKGETTAFVMELPPYRVPTLKAIIIHSWQKGWMYLKKAGTIILAISIVLWLATSYPKPSEKTLSGLSGEQMHQAKLTYSIAGRIGKGIEPVIRPLGFDWKVGIALIGATVAKEVFVSQLAIVYSVDEDNGQTLREKLWNDYKSPLVGFCIMLFCLIATPCLATVVMTRQETGSWGWAGLQFFGLTALAYVITLIVYQVGSLFVA